MTAILNLQVPSDNRNVCQIWTIFCVIESECDERWNNELTCRAVCAVVEGADCSLREKVNTRNV